MSALQLTTAAEIAAVLEGRREGRQRRCRCPIHGGRSLLIRDGDASRILVFCHGGCEARGVLAELRRSGLPGGPSKSYQLPPTRRNDRPDEAARTASALAGGAVRLAQVRAGQWLLVAEGLETTFSVMHACALPGWAALSAGGIKSLVLPPSANMVLICADNDANGVGQRAANVAAERFLA